MFFLMVIGIILLFLVYCYLDQFHSYWKHRNIPYLKPLPVFGNILDIFLLKRNIGEQLAEFYHRGNEKVLGIYMLYRPALLIRDTKLMNEILIKKNEYFVNKSMSQYVEKESEATQGLFSQRDDTWRTSRKIITPAFSLKQDTIAPIMKNAGHKMVGYLQRTTKTNREIDMRDVGVRYCVETGVAFLFGEEAFCFESEHSVYRRIAVKLFDYRRFKIGWAIAMSFISPLLSKIFNMKFLDLPSLYNLVEILEKVLERRKTREKDKLDYLQMLANGMEHYTGEGNKLGPAVEAFAGAFEPTSATLSFGFYELANNSKIQRKLREDIITALQNPSLTYIGKLNEMKYLDHFVKEVLRMYPIVPFLDRICGKDFELEDPKLIIEKNTTVYIPVLAIHRNSEFYPDPDVFRPERFEKDIDWSVYMPFSKGPRLCLAKNYSMLILKSCFVYLLTNFELKKCPRTPKKLEFSKRGFSLQIADELFLELELLDSCCSLEEVTDVNVS